MGLSFYRAGQKERYRKLDKIVQSRPVEQPAPEPTPAPTMGQKIKAGETGMQKWPGKVIGKFTSAITGAVTEAGNRLADWATTEDVTRVSPEKSDAKVTRSLNAKQKADEQRYLDQANPKRSKSERAGTLLGAVTATGGALLSPISGAFSAAEEVPIAGNIVKYGVNKPFEYAGIAGDFVGQKVIDILPIDDTAKDNLRKPVGELTGFVAQLALGKAAGKAGIALENKVPGLNITGTKAKATAGLRAVQEAADPYASMSAEQYKTVGIEPVTPEGFYNPTILPSRVAALKDALNATKKGLGDKVQLPADTTKVSPMDLYNQGHTLLKGELGKVVDRVIPNPEAHVQAKLLTKIAETQAKGETITPAVGERIVSEVAKEIPGELQGKMTVPTAEGSTTIVTNQRHVLENLIKDNERITYKVVKGLGKDGDGNKVAARFEWDFKKQTGTIYATSKTTAGNLAHELGHFIDRTLVEGVDARFSDLVQDYGKQRSKVHEALAQYAVESIDGPATPRRIDAAIRKLVTDIPKDVARLAVGEIRASFHEKFATAVREVLLKPEESMQAAPAFSKFIQAAAKEKGVFADIVKEVKKTPEAKTMPAHLEKLIQETPATKPVKGYSAQVIRANGTKEAYSIRGKDFKKVWSKIDESGRGMAGKPNAKGDVWHITAKSSAAMRKQGFAVKGAVSSTDIGKAPKAVESPVRSAVAKTEQTPAPVVQTTTIANKPAKTPSGDGTFASTGLKTGKTVADRPSFNLEKINAPEDVQNVIGHIAESNKEFRGQRMAKTDEAVRELAQLVDVTPEQLAKLKPGSIANAETLFKSRQLIMDMAQDLRDTIKGTTTETASPAAIKVVTDKLFRLQATMKAVAGMRTEAANVFRQFKMEVRPGENDLLRELVSELKKVDGKAGDDFAAFTKGAKELLEPTAMDKAWHIWYANILSGASTQVKNFAGNIGNMMAEASVELVTNPKQFPRAMSALYQGLMEGKGEFKRIMREGDVSKFEEQGRKPIKFTLGAEEATGMSKTVRKGAANFLNAFDYVGRFMSATDSFFRMGFKNWEKTMQAVEVAKQEKLKGAEFETRVQELADVPTPEMLEKADAFAARGTYTSQPRGAVGAFAEGLSKAMGYIPVLGRLILPFSRIVANVLNVGLDYTPLGFKRALLPDITKMKVMEKYAFPKLEGRQMRQQLGRAAIGTAAMVYFGTLAAQDRLSGNGPSDTKRREQMMADGWRPNSFKAGDRWIPYQNLGPLAIPMTLVGNYFDVMKYNDMDEASALQRVSAGTLGAANSILSMSFLSGTSDFVTALTNYDRGGEKYFQRFAAQQITGLVPNFVKQTARYFDPGQYEQNDIKEMMLSNLRITGGLKPKLNVFGEAVKGDALTQLQPGPKVGTDPVISYLTSNDLWVGLPGKITEVKPPKEKLPIVNGKKQGRQMTPDEYYNYVKYSGPAIKARLAKELPRLQRLNSTELKQKFVDDIVEDERAKVKRKIELGTLR